MSVDLTIIPVAQIERRNKVLNEEVARNAVERFRADGAIQFNDIIDHNLIREARHAFENKYAHILVAPGHENENVLKVGERRLLITVNLEPPFDDPAIYANYHILQFLNSALGPDTVLDAFGVVCSLSGAPAQHGHRDGGFLFPQAGIDFLLPPAAVTVGIPLLEMNSLHGTTELWLGSHRDSASLCGKMGIRPVVPEGSCLVWDFRLWHGGTPNCSDLARPLLYMTYCRAWWVDHRNFENSKQKPLRLKDTTLSRLSDRDQRLLHRAQVIAE